MGVRGWVLSAALSAGLCFSTAALADAGARDSLLAAERAYSARSAAIGFVAATAEVLADDAAILMDKHPPIVGKAAILAAHGADWPPSERHPRLTWEPTAATVSGDGTMGLTYGVYTFSALGPDGATKETKGTFTTTWRRSDAHAPWRVIMDTGHVGLAP